LFCGTQIGPESIRNPIDIEGVAVSSHRDFVCFRNADLLQACASRLGNQLGLVQV
jgi:hypothetical protein